MSSGYSANQYDDAFRARRLQQYTVPKQYKQYPSTRTGNTKIIASDLGHLLPGVGRSDDSPWGDFKGTWDLPNRLPGNHLSNPCARAQPCQQAVAACPTESCRKAPCAAACCQSCSGICQKVCAETCKRVCAETCKRVCAEACKCSGPCGSACKEACQKACIEACKRDCFEACRKECVEACKARCPEACKEAGSEGCRNACMEACKKACAEVCQMACAELCKKAAACCPSSAEKCKKPESGRECGKARDCQSGGSQKAGCCQPQAEKAACSEAKCCPCD